jgi:hypothetical protein
LLWVLKNYRKLKRVSMSQAKDNQVYKDLVNLTNPYLGPSSERFIDRQIKNHLNKEPSEIKPRDLSLLVDWLSLSMSVLTDDNDIISEYIKKIKLLYKKA